MTARFLLILLALWLVPLAGPEAQPLRELAAEAGTRLVARPQGQAERLLLVRGGNAAWAARDQRFTLWGDGAALRLGENGPDGMAAIGWSGGAHCCWTLHVFARTPTGLVHAGSFPLGKIEPDLYRPQRPGETGLHVPDPALDFWDYRGGRGADISPAIPLRWNGQRLVPDEARMRQGADAALSGPACDRPIDPAALADAPGSPIQPRRYATVDEAAAALRAADWSRHPPAFPLAPAVEAARLAACLIYAGQAQAARSLLRAAFPQAEASRRVATERQMGARLACSRYVATLRRLNGPDAPFLMERCRRNAVDDQAVERAFAH